MNPKATIDLFYVEGGVVGDDNIRLIKQLPNEAH
jgi:hypothetical protein